MTIASGTPTRRGMGAMIILVMSLLLIMALMGMTSHFQTSGAGRTVRRVIDIRTTIEAAESGIAEAVTAVRKSMDTGGSTPECSDDWRSMLLSTLQNPGSLPQGKKVVPKSAKELYAAQNLVVSDVKVDVIDVFLPASTGTAADYNLELPQGVLEFSIEVGGAQRIMSVKKRLRQRRAFYVWVDPTTATSAGDIDPTKSIFRLYSNPLGTVIESP